MNKVFIRTDANNKIATGHVMRCLTIARAIRKLGGEVCFLFADEHSVKLLDESWDYIVLNTVWDNWNLDGEAVTQAILTEEQAVLFVDSYYATPRFFDTLSKSIKIVYLDDLNMFPYRVNTIINYNWLKPFNYEYSGINFPQPKCLLGSEYMPLREEFAKQPFYINPQAKRILITTGGTDQLNLANKILDHVFTDTMLSKLEYHIIVGKFNANKDELYMRSEQFPNIILHENVIDMAHWMRYCDVAISASGTTLYELCACGIPTICLEVASNQKGAIAWQNAGYMLYAGNAYEDETNCLLTVMEKLHELVENRSLCEKLSVKMQSLVDGNGANRIADYLLNRI